MRATPQSFVGGQAEPGQATTGDVAFMFDTDFMERYLRDSKRRIVSSPVVSKCLVCTLYHML